MIIRLSACGRVLPIVLPVAFLIALILLRHVAGPDWLWRYMDPDYFYLFDGINIANLIAPHHIAHPGVPLSVLIGAILRAMHPTSDGAALAAQVIADPQFHLAVTADILIALNALAMFLAGWWAWRTWRDPALALLVQLGPVLSMVTINFGMHVRPEALLIATTTIMAALMVAALDDDRLARHPLRFAVLFGIVAGFGAATKLTAVPVLALMPVFLFGTRHGVIVMWVTAVAAMLFFCLPIAGDLGRFTLWIAQVAGGSGAYGADTGASFDWANYANQVRRMLSRPATAAPLLLGLIAMGWASVRFAKGRPVRTLELRALAGLVLATVAQGLLIAKQPSGHYMIPAFCIGGLTLALSLRLMSDPRWWSDRAARRFGRGVVILTAVLIAAQGISLVRFASDLRQFTADAEPPHLVADGKSCAQIFFYPASHPDYALLMGHYLSGYRYADSVKANIESTSYYLRDWFADETPEIHNTDGAKALKNILADYPCTVFRGGHEGRMRALLRREGLEGLTFAATCGGIYENAYVVGATCTNAKPTTKTTD